MDDTVANIVKLLREAGLLGVLVFILLGGFKRWWLWGWQHDRVVARYQEDLAEARKERDEWKRLVISATVTERRAQERSLV